MKKLLIASFVALPSLALAGGMGSVDLSDYNIVPTNSTATDSVSATLRNSSEAPRKGISTARNSNSERRRSSGLRRRSATTKNMTLRNSQFINYALNGVTYTSYQKLVDMLNTLDQNSAPYTFNGASFTSYGNLVDAVTTFLRGNDLYFFDGRLYNDYWDWVSAYRAQNDTDLGVTRTTTAYRNYGDAYSLSTGLEPIDPKDNTYRGQSREDERQSAAQLKMLRLRRLR